MAKGYSARKGFSGGAGMMQQQAQMQQKLLKMQQEMAKAQEEVEAGRVNCIVTKDLSRFGRDHIMVGYRLPPKG